MPLLNYIELGDASKQSIIIIHGLFGSYKNWSRISQNLAQHYHVVALDCRNHGDSFNSMNMNYHVMANDVFLVAEHLKLNQAVVLGHSMGGKIAMQLVAEHEDYFSQLIVVDIAPIAYQHDYKDLIMPILDLDLTQINSRKEADNALAPFIPQSFIRLFLLQSLAHVGQTWFWKVDWQNLLDNMESIIDAPKIDKTIALNSVFIFGAKSEYYSKEGETAIKQYFSHANIEVVANANHWLHYQHADEFLLLLNKYLPTPSE